MKGSLQGVGSNILAGNDKPPENQQQYDDLKKKLLNEYKKMQKKGNERGVSGLGPSNSAPANNSK
jgi:hypothetical protein